MCDPITSAVLSGGAAVAGIKKTGEFAGDLLTPDINIPKIELPKAPSRAIDPAAQGARAREQRKAQAARGRQSTILTGSGGLTTAATTAPKTLLGQ